MLAFIPIFAIGQVNLKYIRTPDYLYIINMDDNTDTLMKITIDSIVHYKKAGYYGAIVPIEDDEQFITLGYLNNTYNPISSINVGNGLYTDGELIELGDSSLGKNVLFRGNGTYGFNFGEEGINPLSYFGGWVSNQFRFTATSGTGLTFNNSSLDLSTSSSSGYEISATGEPIISAYGDPIFQYSGGTRIKSSTAPIWLGDSHVTVNIGSSTQNLSFLNAYSDNIIFNSDGFYQTNSVGNHQSNATGSGKMEHAANEHIWFGPDYSDHFIRSKFLGDSLLYYYNDTGFVFGKHVGLKYVGVPESSIGDSTLIPKWYADANYGGGSSLWGSSSKNVYLSDETDTFNVPPLQKLTDFTYTLMNDNQVYLENDGGNVFYQFAPFGWDFDMQYNNAYTFFGNSNNGDNSYIELIVNSDINNAGTDMQVRPISFDIIADKNTSTSNNEVEFKVDTGKVSMTFYDNLKFSSDNDSTYISPMAVIDDVLKITPKSSAPSSPQFGWLYVNSTDNHIYFYNGTTWVQMDN